MYWTRRSKVLLIVLMLTLTLGAQERIRCMSYNAENLFDCIDDTLTNDDTFLPQATRHWTRNRYWNKLQAIGSAIAMAGEDRAPDFVALCEVENDSVLHDLTRRSSLRTVRYNYLVTSSTDPRGIDVALLYKPIAYRPFAHKVLRLPSNQIDEGGYVRDVLCVSGELVTGDTLDVLVCHLPSRLNGRKSARLRQRVVTHMCSAIDSLCSMRAMPHIVVMGDFNDDATDDSLVEVMGAKGDVKELEPGDFFNPYNEMLRAGLGTLAYQDEWNLFDNICVTENLVNAEKGKLHIIKGKKFYGNIFTRPYMLQLEGQYKNYPLRTFVSNNFQDGYSDHFPVYIYIGK